MKKAKIILLGLIIACFSTFGAFAQTSSIVKKELSQAEIDRIVKAFTMNEAAFRDALRGYVFNRSATIQTIGMGGQVSGMYRRDSFLNLAEDGTRSEKILYAPISTLTELRITEADIDNLSGSDPFAIDPAAVSQYNFTFLGTEKIDELSLYVFDVSPKVIGRPLEWLATMSSAEYRTSSTSSIVMPCSAMCWTLPAESSSRSQITRTMRIGTLLSTLYHMVSIGQLGKWISSARSAIN